MHELPSHADLGLDENTLLAGPLLARKKRGITRYQISESIHAFTPDATTRRRLEKTPTLHWVPLNDLETITLSGPHRRWVTELLAKFAR
jgi:A/G-specific adenine glycosylase